MLYFASTDNRYMYKLNSREDILTFYMRTVESPIIVKSKKAIKKIKLDLNMYNEISKKQFYINLDKINAYIYSNEESILLGYEI